MTVSMPVELVAHLLCGVTLFDAEDGIFDAEGDEEGADTVGDTESPMADLRHLRTDLDDHIRETVKLAEQVAKVRAAQELRRRFALLDNREGESVTAAYIDEVMMEPIHGE